VGTVTWVDGDRVLMFGHPFLQRGAVALPLAAAQVVALFPSRELSFKIGSIGPVVGTLLYDERAGLVGELGTAPPLVPVEVEIVRNGDESQDFAFQVADDEQLTPVLAFWCLYNALLARGDDQSRQTLRYELVSRWTADGDALAPVVQTGQVVGPGGAAALATEWMAPLRVLLANRHRSLELQGVSARLEVSRPVAAAVITGVTARSVVRAGEKLQVAVSLETYREPDRVEAFTLDLPAQLPPGPYRLAAASAREFFALETQRAAALFRDRSLDATLALIRKERSAATLVVALIAPGGSVVVAGRELEDLPGSVVRALRPGGGGVEPALASYAVRAERDTDLALDGHAILDVVVKPAARITPEEPRP
jgi:hypothetical protein